MKKNKRKICFVITSKIHYSRSKFLLEELNNHPDIDLQIVLGGSALLEQYGNVEPFLIADGYQIKARILMSVSGGSVMSMAKTSGLGLIEFSSVLESLNPDIVLVRGDRFEILPLVTAAVYMNKMVAHIEGGDLTGTIDESVRHAVTKLSHIHFATNEDSKKRIIKMGENPDYVFNVGDPAIELLHRHRSSITNKSINTLGVGDIVDVDKPFVIVMFHPVTTEIEKSQTDINNLLKAVSKIKIPAIWFWPNIDAGGDVMSKAIRIFREQNNPQHIRFLKYISEDKFLGLLKKAKCLIGNSSSGVKESSYIGLPVVNIGSRQNGRYRSLNVVDVPSCDTKEIYNAILKQCKKDGAYKKDHYYFKPNTSKNIVQILSSIPLYRQKRFID